MAATTNFSTIDIREKVGKMRADFLGEVGSLNLLFTSYLVTNSYAKSPLNESKNQNIATLSPSKNVKHVEAMARMVVENALKLDCFEKTGGEELGTESEVISKGFRCLYRCSGKSGDSIGTIKKHQVYIIRLIEFKQLESALEELAFLQQIVNRVVNVHATVNNSGNTTSFVLDTVTFNKLLEGITFNKTFLECVNEIQKEQIVNLTVAFQFLVLQCILQYSARNYKRILSNRDRNISWDTFASIPSFFLSSQNFSQWLDYSYSICSNKAKHINNINKMINGFSKLVDTMLTKCGETNAVTLSRCKAQLVLKSIQYQLLKKNDYEIGFFTPSPGVFDSLIPYVDDLKRTICVSLMESSKSEKLELYLSGLQITYNDETPDQNISALIKDLLNKPEKSSVGKLAQYLLVDADEVRALSKENMIVVKMEFFLEQIISNSVIEVQLNVIEIFLKYFRIALKHSRTLSKCHIALFDHITRHIKQTIDNFKENSDVNGEVVSTMLDYLFEILSKFKQFKRIKNLSNLGFNHGLKNSPVTEILLPRALSYEFFVLKNIDASNYKEFYYNLMPKFEKFSKVMLKRNELDAYFPVLMKYLELFPEQFNIGVHDVMKQPNEIKLSPLISILCKCFLFDTQHISDFFSSIKLSDCLKVRLYIQCIDYIELNLDKLQVLSIFESMKLSLIKVLLSDDLLYLCAYHGSRMNGLPHNPDYELPKQDSSSKIQRLMLSGILIQEITRIPFLYEKLDSCVENFKLWLISDTADLPDLHTFEFEILKLIVDFMKYNGLNGYIVSLLSYYAEHSDVNYECSHTKCLKMYTELELCKANIALNRLVEASNNLMYSGHLIKKLSSTNENFGDFTLSHRDLMIWKLLQFKYCLSIGNRSHAKEKFNTLVKFIDSKPDFSLKQEHGATLKLDEKLKNLTVIATFQLYASELNVELANFAEALENLRITMKVLLSILKNLGLDFRKGTFDELRWITGNLLLKSYVALIKIHVQMGITRDLEFYMVELEKLIDLSSCPIENCLACLSLAKVYALMYKPSDSRKFLERCQNNFDSSGISNVELSLAIEQTKFTTSACQLKTMRACGAKVEELSATSLEMIESKKKIESLISMLNDNLLTQSSEDSKQACYAFNWTETFTNDAFLIALFDTSICHPSFKGEDKLSIQASMLKVVANAKAQILQARESLLSIPRYSAIREVALCFPGLNFTTYENQGQFDDNDTNEAKIAITNKLVQAKELLLNVLNQTNIKFLSNFELEDTVKYLLDCFFSISMLTTLKLDDKAAVDRSLWEPHYFLDYAKYLPFFNDQQKRRMEPFRQVNNELLPPNFLEADTSKEMRGLLGTIKVHEILPAKWTVVTIETCPYSGDLLLTRYTKSDNVPSFFKLPLGRILVSGGSDCKKMASFSSVINLLKDVIKKSDLTTKPEVTLNIKTKDDRKNWWKLRFALDMELKNLLEHVETMFLGAFSGIFSTSHLGEDITAKFSKELGAALTEVIPQTMISTTNNNESIITKELAEIFLHSADIVFSNGNIQSEDDNTDKKNAFLHDVMYFLVHNSIFHGNNIDLKYLDTKAVFSKLENLFTKYSLIFSRIKMSKTKDEMPYQNHLVIVPSPECSIFPWESLGCMAEVSVSRMPSIGLLCDSLRRYSSDDNITPLSNEKTYYMINPGSDLKRTEEKFGPQFKANDNWKGVIGEKPDEESFLNSLKSNDVFVYLGHGGCEQYIRTSSLFKSFCSTDTDLPPALLIGCSSGSLNYNGLLGANGTVYNWLTCGSPMMLVNLWDVTDKDIDCFSSSVFDKWGFFGKDNSRKMNICQAVAISRLNCTLKYLNGSAPIVYGLPFKL